MTRSALQNAASIAALFLTTEAVIADKPEKEAARHARRRRHGLLSPRFCTGSVALARPGPDCRPCSSSITSSSASARVAEDRRRRASSPRACLVDEQPHEHAEDRADQREDDEHPQLTERVGVGVGEDRRRQAARRVDAGVVDRDRHEVDDGERDAGDQPAEPGREPPPGRRQHDEHEQGREHDLDDDRRAEPAEAVAVPAVRREACRAPSRRGRWRCRRSRPRRRCRRAPGRPTRTRRGAASILRASSIPSVTAGLMWQPLTGPITYAIDQQGEGRTRARPRGCRSRRRRGSRRPDRPSRAPPCRRTRRRRSARSS